MSRSLLLVALLALPVRADTLLRDKNAYVGPVTGFNCSGSGITCWRDAGIGQLYVDGGGYNSGTNSGDQTKYCGDGGYITTLAAGTASVCAYVVASGGSGTVSSVIGTQPIVITGTPTTTPTVTFNDDGGWRNSIDSATFPLRISSANINCSSATATDAGCLTAADWVTFNAKGNGVVTSIGNGTNTTVSGTAAVPIVSLSGTVPQTLGGTGAGALTCGATERITSNGTAYSCSAVPQGTVTSVSGTQPIVVATGTTTPAITFYDDGGWRNLVNSATAPIVLSSGVLTCTPASGSVNGCLSSTDWTTFNNKGSGTVTSVSGTAPIVSSGGATPAISMPAAGAGVSGYLTSAGGVSVLDAGLTLKGALTLGWEAGGGYGVIYSPGHTTNLEASDGRVAMTYSGGEFSGSPITNRWNLSNPLDMTGWLNIGRAGGISLDAGLLVGAAGTSAGTAGQVLTSGGAGAPMTWTTASGSGTVTSVSGTSPISVATGTTTPVISMTSAGTGVSGYLKVIGTDAVFDGGLDLKGHLTLKGGGASSVLYFDEGHLRTDMYDDGAKVQFDGPISLNGVTWFTSPVYGTVSFVGPGYNAHTLYYNHSRLLFGSGSGKTWLSGDGGVIYTTAGFNADRIEVESGVFSSRAVPVAASTPAVTWTNAVGVTVSGNDLSKPSGTGWSAGAYSSDTLSTDGYIEFTTADATHNWAAGFSNTDTDQNYSSLNYSFITDSAGNLFVAELGVVKYSGTYAGGNTFRIEVTGTSVAYKKNGTTLYTSLTACSFPLHADTSLYDTGATVNDMVMSVPGINSALDLEATASIPAADKLFSVGHDGGVKLSVSGDGVATLSGGMKSGHQGISTDGGVFLYNHLTMNGTAGATSVFYGDLAHTSSLYYTGTLWDVYPGLQASGGITALGSLGSVTATTSLRGADLTATYFANVGPKGISTDGGFRVGAAGTDVGAAGQILKSNGNNAPVWGPVFSTGRSGNINLNWADAGTCLETFDIAVSPASLNADSTCTVGFLSVGPTGGASSMQFTAWAGDAGACVVRACCNGISSGTSCDPATQNYVCSCLSP